MLLMAFFNKLSLQEFKFLTSHMHFKFLTSQMPITFVLSFIYLFYLFLGALRDNLSLEYIDLQIMMESKLTMSRKVKGY